VRELQWLLYLEVPFLRQMVQQEVFSLSDQEGLVGHGVTCLNHDDLIWFHLILN